MDSAYTTPLSVTSQFMFCGLPLRLDTYRGCAFQCAFCFARRRGGNTPEAKVVPASVDQIRNTIERALSSSNPDGMLAQFLRRRVPIHFGGMSDPFQQAELRYGVSRTALALLARHDYPTVISTRSILLASPQYLEILRSMSSVVVQFSMSTADDEIAKRSEPRSYSPSALLKAMNSLASSGINVTCRWQPYIPGVSEPPRQFAARVASSGCKHVSLEHLKVPMERYDRAWQVFGNAVGVDFPDMYKAEGAIRDGREYILPASSKRYAVLAAAAEIRAASMTFGAADNEFQYLSDTACCCSGADQFPGFQNFFKHQIAYAIRKCRGRKISYDCIKDEWAPTGSIDRFLNSRTRIGQKNAGSSSVRDHIMRRWNAVGTAASPTSFFGVVHIGSKQGMNVYDWYKWNVAH